MSRAIDWSAIKVAYVTSTKSYKGIAAEYGLPFASVAKKGRADGWPSLRKAFQEEAACRAIASGVDDEADRLANVMKAANAMGAALADVFSDADQFHRHLVQEYDGDSGRTVFGDLFIGKSPVLVGIVVTYDRSGMNVINKIRTVHARRDAASKITEESVLYLDENKKRTQDWFQALGTNLPLGGTKYGFIRSIAQPDDSVKFSLRAPVEQAGNLIAVHNLSEFNLDRALRLGGFPMPSIAVAKTDMGHQNFGGISLVFGRETIDPMADRRNKVYSADAWTPTFPRVEYETDSAAEKRIRNRLRPLEGQLDAMFVDDLRRVQGSLEDYLNRNGGEQGLIQYVADNYGLKAAYLEEQGVHIAARTRQEQVNPGYNESRVDKYEAVLDALGTRDADAIGNMRMNEMRNQYGDALEDAFPGMTKSALRMSGILSQVQAYLRNRNQGPTFRTVTDADATRRAVDEALDERSYRQWVGELFSGIEGASGIYNNKPLYTSSGNRRSFAATHYPVTIENIARAMAGENGGNTKNVSGFHGVKSLRAATAKTFKSVEDMHRSEERLRAQTQEEADALTDQLNATLNSIIGEVLDGSPELSSGNRLIDMDTVGEILIEIAEKRYTAASIQKKFAEYRRAISAELAGRIKSLLDETAVMPVNIFEAKPERAVYFDEVKYAIVPDTMDADVRARLEAAVSDVREYREGDEAQRLELLNAREDVKFQLRDPYQISNREILANALEGAAQNETERDWLKRYKKKARALGEKQMRLEDINARIVSLRKSENTLENRETIRKLEAGAKVLSDSIQRADKEMLKLESFQPLRDVMKRERVAWKEKARATMNERISEYRAGQREKVRERIQAVREREAEKRKNAVEHTREVGQRRVERLKESEMKAKYKARILKDSATMREWLTRPTTKGHVPEFLRGPLGAFMESLDFTSDRALRGGDPTQADRNMLESMEAMRRALASVKKQQSDIDDGKAAFSGYLDLPGGFAEEFDDLTERIKQTLQQGGTDIPINRMTGEQLKSLSRMIRAINTSVRNMNRLLANAKYESAVRAADSTMAELAKLGDKVNTNTVLDKARNFMDWTNATPYYVFKRFGDGGKAIFEGLMDGWDRLAFNSKELIDYTNSLYKPRQVREWSRELHTVALSGKDVQLTAAQIMSLYCLSKREQAVGHLLGGGIRVGDIQSKGKQIVQADNYTLNMEDIQAITGKLTAQQKEVADKLQSFMSTRCAEWGNEVSMKRFGYEMFGEENYFPIKTDSNNRKAIDDQAQENSLFRLLNLSATKSLVQNANNAIILENIFDVFSAHATDMAKYNALGLQILDALKWYNYVEKTVNEDGTITTASVQKSLEKAYGRDAQRYIKNFLRDLNGVREGGRNDGLFNMFVSNYKIAAVAANLRVGLLQITSMPRAAYAIHPKYLAIGMAKNVAFRNSKIAEEKVGISLWKSLGFYDTNIARNVREMVKHDQGIGGTIREKSMILAEKGDAWTMGVLYGAVEAEMAEKHRDVRKGSAAYDKMLNDRMREIIYQTQVVDSTMTRSDIMRDRSKAASLATAFMSEPTLTMNMLADSIFEQRMKARKTGKRFMPSAKMWKAFAVNSVVVGLAAIMESLFTAERDDDEYETFMEKFMDALVGEYDDEMTRGQKALEFMNSSLGGNMNLLNNIPYVKNVIDGITNGEGSSALYDEWIVTLFGGIQEVYKYATGQSSNPPYNGIYKTINGLSQMSGFALGSLTRELVSAYNTFIAEPLGYKRIQTYTDSASDAASAILRAYLAGDDELAAHYTSIASQHGIEGEKLEKAMNNAARDAFEAGSIDAATAQDILSAYGGKGENDAYWIVREWESGEEDYSRYGNLRTALAEGDGSAATAAYHELVEHGAEEKTVLGEISKLYNSGEATNLLNLQLRSNNLYTSTLKLETDGEKHPDDFDGFITAIVNGRGISTEIGKLLEKGYTVKQCMSAINGAFGKSADRYRIMEQYNRSDAATLLNRILDAYEVLGLDRNEEKAWIDANWIMEG